MIRKPDCTSLQLNPFNIYVSSTSIFNSAERTQRPLIVTIFGKNCFRKLQRKVSWTASVGTRVLRLKDFIHEEDPASLRLRETQWRKYFRFDAKSDYLVLRKSLLRLQENTLVVELAFPVGSKNASENKQGLKRDLSCLSIKTQTILPRRYADFVVDHRKQLPVSPALS